MRGWLDKSRFQLSQGNDRAPMSWTPNELVDPSYQQVTMQARDSSIMTGSVFIGLGSLPCLCHWPLTTTLHRNLTICPNLRPLCTPTRTGYSRMIMHIVIGPKLFRTDCRCILETSSELCGHYIRLTWNKSNIYGTWWSGLIARKIRHLTISGSCGQLSRWHIPRALQMLFNHLRNRWHVALLRLG